VRPGRKVCEAMRGLVEEAQHEIEEQYEKGPILDLVIVAGMQRIEHYEIAAYGTDGRWPQRSVKGKSPIFCPDARGGKADRPQADGSDTEGDHARGVRRRGGRRRRRPFR
jgi:hypothetical protein